MKKKYFNIILLSVATIGLAACGGQTQGGMGGKGTVPGGNFSSVTPAGTEWRDINENNYVDIIKAKTEIDFSKLAAHTINSASGYSTQIAEVNGNYTGGTTKVTMFESLIKELLRVSNNSVWSTDVNLTTYRIEKVDEYTDYESYYNYEIQGNEDLEFSLSGTAHINDFNVGYTFATTTFNIRITHYVIN